MLNVLNKIATKFGYRLIKESELDTAIAQTIELKKDIIELQELYLMIKVEKELERIKPTMFTLHPN